MTLHWRRNLINDIPFDLICAIACLWLPVHDVVILSSAFTNNHGRGEFLQFLADPRNCFRYEPCDREPSCEELSWLWQKRLCIYELELSNPVLMFCQMHHSQQQQHTRLVLTHLRSIRLCTATSRNNRHFLCNIFNAVNCPDFVHLKTLRCHFGSENRLVFLTMIHKAKHLEEVTIRDLGNKKPNLVDGDLLLIVANCRQLKVLYVYAFVELTHNTCMALTANLHQLTSLSLPKVRYPKSFLASFALSKCARNITTLSLDVSIMHSVSLTSIACLLVRLPSIERLTLFGLDTHSAFDVASLSDAIRSFSPFLLNVTDFLWVRKESVGIVA